MESLGRGRPASSVQRAASDGGQQLHRETSTGSALIGLGHSSAQGSMPEEGERARRNRSTVQEVPRSGGRVADITTGPDRQRRMDANG